MTSGTGVEVEALITAFERERSSAETLLDAEKLLLLVYPDLRRLARKYMAAERASHTLQPTAVVHDAYCQLVDSSKISWKGRTHFFAVSARAMRRILVDHARAKRRIKRGGDQQRVTLVEDRNGSALDNLCVEDLLTVHTALERLAEVDPRQAQILELRFFGGLTMAEIAATLDVSKRTVEGDWAHARVWLERELESMCLPR